MDQNEKRMRDIGEKRTPGTGRSQHRSFKGGVCLCVGGRQRGRQEASAAAVGCMVIRIEEQKQCDWGGLYWLL